MRLSACMMVKNEEELLPQCLESIKNIVDEIIVVDTGSTDQTVSIAKKFGAKVYHHPWENNFSKHRNQSISYATGDWILIIDADEKLVLAPDVNKRKIKEQLNKVPDKYWALAIRVQDYQRDMMVMACNSARVFRKGKIEYTGTVHNQPKFEGVAVMFHDFWLNHYGYDLSRNKMQAKFRRSCKLLMEQWNSQQNPTTAFYLSQLHGQHGHRRLCRRWAEKYLEWENELRETKKLNYTIFFTLIKEYQEAREEEKSYELIQRIMKERPDDPDIAYCLSDHGAIFNKLNLMAEGCRRYIKGFRSLLQDPAKMGGQFYFSFREDLYGLQLYRLAIASAQESREAWNYLRNRLIGNETFIPEMTKNITSLGLGHMMNDFPHLITPMPQEINF